MATQKRPWVKLTPAERIEAVRPLEAANRANSTIAFELKAPRPDINKICTFLRRERHAHNAAPESQSGAEFPVAPAPHLGVSPAGRDSDESPVFNPEAKTSEDNGATVLADTLSDPANSVTGEASRVDAGRTASATSETMDATAGETAQISPEGANDILGGVAGACSGIKCGENRTGTESETSGDSVERHALILPSDGDAIAAVKGRARLASADGVEPPPSEPSRPAAEDEPQAPPPRTVIEDVPPLAPDLMKTVSRPSWHTTDRETRDGIVLRLRGEGLSNSQIAARFTDCPSRSAVAGIFNRLRQSGVATPAPPRPKARQTVRISAPAHTPPRARPVAPKPVVVRTPKQNLHAGNIARKATSRQFDPIEIALPRNRAAAFEPLPDTVPVLLLDLTSTTCRWPVNGFHGREAIFCGAACEIEHSYCAAHRQLSYSPRAVSKEART